MAKHVQEPAPGNAFGTLVAFWERHGCVKSEEGRHGACTGTNISLYALTRVLR